MVIDARCLSVGASVFVAAVVVVVVICGVDIGSGNTIRERKITILLFPSPKASFDRKITRHGIQSRHTSKTIDRQIKSPGERCKTSTAVE